MVNTKRIILLLFLLFICIGTVTGGGGETTTDYTYYDVTTYQDIAYAEEDGHFDIQFSDDYKGYCFEYGEEEATKGDKFYVEQTDYILSTKGQDVSNYLKLYFIDYYNETQKDKIVTQHTIWHFTDDFDGWRVNKTLVNDIKSTSEYKKLPDDGTVSWNTTHNMIYSFRSLVSPLEDHQNFFGYKIRFDEKNSTNHTCECNNTGVNNYTNIINNNILNHLENTTNNYINNTTNNITNISEYYESYVFNDTNYTIAQINNSSNVYNIHIIYITSHVLQEYNVIRHSTPHMYDSKTVNLSHYKTGNTLVIVVLFIVIIALVISNRGKN